MSSTELKSGADGLFQVGVLTQKMREHQKAISELAQERKLIVEQLRDNYGTGKNKITYKQIGIAMGTTDQSVYKILMPAKEKTVKTPDERITILEERIQRIKKKKAKKTKPTEE
jgi:coenzyme F420-reducing hydrogenase delta subunit